MFNTILFCVALFVWYCWAANHTCPVATMLCRLTWCFYVLGQILTSIVWTIARPLVRVAILLLAVVLTVVVVRPIKAAVTGVAEAVMLKIAGK